MKTLFGIFVALFLIAMLGISFILVLLLGSWALSWFSVAVIGIGTGILAFIAGYLAISIGLGLSFVVIMLVAILIDKGDKNESN